MYFRRQGAGVGHEPDWERRSNERLKVIMGGGELLLVSEVPLYRKRQEPAIRWCRA